MILKKGMFAPIHSYTTFSLCNPPPGPWSPNGMRIPTNVISRCTAPMTVCLLQGQDLEGGQGCGARLGGDHASEPGHSPCTNMVVIRTHWKRESIGVPVSVHEAIVI